MPTVIRKGLPEEFEAVRKLYDDCSSELHEWDFLPNGSDGSFPTDEMIRTALAAGLLFLAEVPAGYPEETKSDEKALAAALIADHEGEPEYAIVPWQAPAPDEELYILHALRVLKRWQGYGLAKALMAAAVEDARAAGMKAVRLDTLPGDDAAIHIYESLGFREAMRMDMNYPDIGDVVGIMYEKVL